MKAYLASADVLSQNGLIASSELRYQGPAEVTLGPGKVRAPDGYPSEAVIWG